MPEPREVLAEMPLRLPPLLDMAAAVSLKSTLMPRLSKGLSLDASGVERAGTPAIQVIHAAATACHDLGVRFHIVAASEAFTAACTELGLAEPLSSWIPRDV